MKSMIKKLFLDKELVDNIKKEKINKDHLYNQLFFGKITLQEYLKLV